MRTIDSAILARFEAKELRPFVLVDMNVDGTHYRYTDCDVPLVVGGYRYSPRGLKTEPVRYSTGTVVDSVKIKLDNLDDQFTAMFVDGTPQGSEVTLQIVLVEQWGEVDDETGSSWGPTVHGLSLADGQAFIAASGVDLSPYAGVEGTSTPYMITVHDSAGKTARGYIGAADAGETLGSNIITTNPGFESALTSGTDDDANSDNFPNWTETNDDANGAKTLAMTDSVHGGTRAAKIIRGTVLATMARAIQALTTDGKLYKLSVWNHGDGTYSGRITLSNAWSTTYTGITGTSYAETVWYFTDPAANVSLTLYPPGFVNAYAYFDDISIQEVTNGPATGVHIVSEKDGSTRNWTSIDSGFDYNDSAYTFEVRDTSSGTNRAYFVLNDAVTLFQGTIDGWNLDEEEVSFTIASELVKWNQRTLSRHSASCRWKEFKGTECAYAGAEIWCDRTYTRCVALGNQANFGGFRWLPSIVNKQIWWGRQMSGV